MTFVHPGGLTSKTELDFVKAKIKSGVVLGEYVLKPRSDGKK